MTAYGIPAPRRLSLPRVKFKRPRWPKGDRVWFGLTVAYLLLSAPDIAAGLWGWVAFDLTCAYASGWLWWRSRRDDDGPSAT